MTRYAADTSVSVERSRGELERTLARYGATSFVYGWNGASAIVQFEARMRRIRFTLPLPDRQADEFTKTPTGRERSAAQAEAAWEQAQRSAWRALNLVVKAKLEAVECGIVTFEDEFLAFMVTAGGTTVGEQFSADGALDRALNTGNLPALMPGAS